MEIIIVSWIFLSVIFAAIGRERKIGFWVTLAFCLLLSPIVGLIIALTSTSLEEDDFRKKLLYELKLVRSSLDDRMTLSDIELLNTMLDRNIITQEEFKVMKDKWIEKD